MQQSVPQPCLHVGSIEVWAEAGRRGGGMGKVLLWLLFYVTWSFKTADLRDTVPRKPLLPTDHPP